MSIVKHILEEEYNRLLDLVKNYKDKLESLPKGSISKKERNNNIYLYRAFRKSGKVCFVYLGKEGSPEREKAKSDYAEWIKYRDLLKKVSADLKEIKKALNGYR